MALVKCAECGADISSKAPSCPKCGAQLKNKSGPGCASVLIGSVLVVTVVISISTCGRTPKATTGGLEASARSACATFLRRSARDPDSFDPIEQWGWATVKNADGTWSVLGHYRAKNGFGGIAAEKTTCIVKQTEKDSWTLITLSRMQ